MRFAATIHIPVEVEAEVTRGTRPYLDRGGVWQPAVPDEVTNLKVFLGDLDITEYLPDSAYHRVEELSIEKFHDFSKEVDYDES